MSAGADNFTDKRFVNSSISSRSVHCLQLFPITQPPARAVSVKRGHENPRQVEVALRALWLELRADPRIADRTAAQIDIDDSPVAAARHHPVHRKQRASYTGIVEIVGRETQPSLGKICSKDIPRADQRLTKAFRVYGIGFVKERLNDPVIVGFVFQPVRQILGAMADQVHARRALHGKYRPGCRTSPLSGVAPDRARRSSL